MITSKRSHHGSCPTLLLQRYDSESAVLENIGEYAGAPDGDLQLHVPSFQSLVPFRRIANKIVIIFCFLLSTTQLLILAIMLHSARTLAIEHPQSYSLFKRGIVLGDMTYSYASTDMGSSNGGRVKTVTVIKNVALPKPTSTVFSDRTEQLFESYDLTGNKQHEQVQYWPADETNRMKKITIKPPSFSIPETKEFSEDGFKHPIDLLEIAKSAAKTQNKIMKAAPGDDTGPVMFPPDAQMMKKRNNGVVSVAKEYTSVLTNDQKERSKPKTASKLSTKVETPTIKENQYENYKFYDPSSFYQDDFEQSEYVYTPESNSYALKQVSKAPTAIKNRLKNTQFAYKDPSLPSTTDFTMYSSNDSTPDLLFSELANAVASRNISMIKSLAGQLDEPYTFPKFDFESLKTDEYVPISFEIGHSNVNQAEPTSSTETIPKLEFSDDAYTTTLTATTTTTATPAIIKKPSKYIAPRLRGIKRFSSRKQ
ncbi:uncharacterized protein LOC131688034 [Topomyia yanbarensis]|uniref:uncharacterized protein LOC131688034 n=1 Tax=Topomyia yanbarensis TaxID=2498891 RepID=UPI00273C0063|nr:uncharacterized protein LOC131688034 [Topomyia yanbarensis]